MKKYPGASGWEWPVEADVEDYEDILSQIETPKVISNRNTGRYRVPEMDVYWGQ